MRLPKCRHSIWVLLHSAGGLVLSSVMRGSKAPGSKYLPRTRGSRKSFKHRVAEIWASSGWRNGW